MSSVHIHYRYVILQRCTDSRRRSRLMHSSVTDVQPTPKALWPCLSSMVRFNPRTLHPVVRRANARPLRHWMLYSYCFGDRPIRTSTPKCPVNECSGFMNEQCGVLDRPFCSVYIPVFHVSGWVEQGCAAEFIAVVKYMYNIRADTHEGRCRVAIPLSEWLL